LNEKCDNGQANGKDGKCSLTCELIPPTPCGNGVIDDGETCKTCPEDVRRCATECGNGVIELDEECDNGQANGKDGKCSPICKLISPPLCGNEVIDDGEKCETCPEDVRRCITRCGNGVVELQEKCDNGEANGKDGRCSINCTPELCPNGVQDPGETCENCPQDMGRCIIEKNCLTCPCQFADIASDLSSNDKVRAKLRDAPRNVFYTYSPDVFVSRFSFM
jgi:cysteine-rich repeat protein